VQVEGSWLVFGQLLHVGPTFFPETFRFF
jgi:hypothetical protein